MELLSHLSHCTEHRWKIFNAMLTIGTALGCAEEGRRNPTWNIIQAVGTCRRKSWQPVVFETLHKQLILDSITISSWCQHINVGLEK